jgi:hypothetical protein
VIFLQKSLRLFTGVGATGLKFTGVGATGFDFKRFYYGGPFDPQELPERHRPVCQRQEIVGVAATSVNDMGALRSGAFRSPRHVLAAAPTALTDIFQWYNKNFMR